MSYKIYLESSLMEYNLSNFDDARKEYRFWIKKDHNSLYLHYGVFEPNEGCTDKIKKIVKHLRKTSTILSYYPFDKIKTAIFGINRIVQQHNVKVDPALLVKERRGSRYEILDLKKIHEKFSYVGKRSVPQNAQTYMAQLVVETDWRQVHQQINPLEDSSEEGYFIIQSKKTTLILNYNPKTKQIERWIGRKLPSLKTVMDNTSQNNFWQIYPVCKIQEMTDFDELTVENLTVKYKLNDLLFPAVKNIFKFYQEKQRIVLSKLLRQDQLNQLFWGILHHDSKRITFKSNPSEAIIDLLLPLVTEFPIEQFREHYKLFATYGFETLIRKFFEIPEIPQTKQAKKLLVRTIQSAEGLRSKSRKRIGDKYSRNWHAVLFMLQVFQGNGESCQIFYSQAFEQIFKNFPRLKINIDLIPQILDHLLKLKIDVSVKIRGLTPLEHIYLSPHIPTDLKVKILSRLIDAGAHFSRGQLDKFKRDLTKGDTSLLQVLYRNNHLTQEELEVYTKLENCRTSDWTFEDIEDLMNQLSIETQKIQLLYTRSNLASDALNFRQVAFWRQMKKETKSFLRDERIHNLRAYPQFCKAYDLLVDKNPVLKLLRTVSKEIRMVRYGLVEAVSMRLIKMIALWDHPSQKKLDQSQTISYLQTNPKSFRGIYQRITVVAQRYFQDPFWYQCRDLWVHGTSSVTLPLVKKFDEKKFLSTSTLLKKGVAPFFGLLDSARVRKHEKKLSGQTLSPNFEEVSFLPDNAGTQLLASIFYISESNQGHFCRNMLFNLTETWKRVDPAAFKKVIRANLSGDVDEIMLSNDALFHLQIDILRLRMVDLDAREKLEDLKRHLTFFIEKECSVINFESLDFVKSCSQAALQAIDREIPFTLTPEEQKMFLEPYPILIGCPDQRPVRQENSYDGYLNPEGIAIGKEIQMVFADKFNHAELKEILADDSVHVEDFDMAYMMETMEMFRGSSVEPSLLQYNDFLKAQTQINHILQRDILPNYAARMPEKPVYLDKHGRLQFVPRPHYGNASNYKDYIDQVENGKLPRGIYDCMYAARVVFFGMVQVSLFQKKGRPVDNPILVAAAIGHHNSARQDEGQDLYAEASGENLRIYLERYGLPPEKINVYVHAVKEKNPSDDNFINDIQRIVHNAVYWETLRDIPQHVFNISNLHFETVDLESEYLAELTGEIKAFIDQTENQTLKKKLEWESQNYYRDLLEIFGDTHQEKNCYPLLMDLMKGAIPL